MAQAEKNNNISTFNSQLIFVIKDGLVTTKSHSKKTYANGTKIVRKNNPRQRIDRILSFLVSNVKIILHFQFFHMLIIQIHFLAN